MTPSPALLAQAASKRSELLSAEVERQRAQIEELSQRLAQLEQSALGSASASDAAIASAGDLSAGADRDTRLVADYRSGMSTLQLAERYSISYQRVHQILRRDGVETRSPAEVNLPRRQHTCRACGASFFQRRSVVIDGVRIQSVRRYCSDCQPSHTLAAIRARRLDQAHALLGDIPVGAPYIARGLGISRSVASRRLEQLVQQGRATKIQEGRLHNAYYARVSS